jgi:hypothetical protein
MNHKILANQIMLSFIEGYLSSCPSLSLSLSALSLSYPAIKNFLARSLLSTWSLLGLIFPYKVQTMRFISWCNP